MSVGLGEENWRRLVRSSRRGRRAGGKKKISHLETEFPGDSSSEETVEVVEVLLYSEFYPGIHPSKGRS